MLGKKSWFNTLNSAQPEIVATPILWLDAETITSGSGIYNWADISGANIILTNRNSVPFSPTSPKNFSFDGTDTQNFNTSTVSALGQLGNDDHTIMIFANPAGYDEDDIVGSDVIGTAGSFLFMLYAGIFRGHVWAGNGLVVIDSASGPTLNTWSCFTQRMKYGDTLKLYNKKTEVASVSAVGKTKPNLTNSKFALGARSITRGLYNGKIGAVLIYNRALTVAEIEQNIDYYSTLYNL